jgi:release factor glutamine methyltransferase
MSDVSEAKTADEWTIQRVLAWAAEDFRRRGLDSPRLDAELLLAQVLGVDRIRLILDGSRVLDARELAAYRELIQRRRRAEPVAYILGVREFFGLPFHVDARVLVPRPDTETLVEVALERTRDLSLHGDALDLCTGSGCVAVAFAKRRPTWSVVGTDVSREAVTVAQGNAERLGAVWSARFVESDLDRALPDDARFDLVTANPPYIPTDEIPTLQADVRDHEPRLALDGGKDGLEVVRRVVAVAAKRLRPNGILALEIGAGQAAAVVRMLEAAGFDAIESRKDYGGIDRVVSGRRPAR